MKHDAARELTTLNRPPCTTALRISPRPPSYALLGLSAQSQVSYLQGSSQPYLDLCPTSPVLYSARVQCAKPPAISATTDLHCQVSLDILLYCWKPCATFVICLS